MTIPKDLLDKAIASYDVAVDYFNERDGAGLVKFGQQILDAGAAGARSRQAEVDKLTTDRDTALAGKAASDQALADLNRKIDQAQGQQP